MCICPYIYQSVACVCINAMHRGALYAYALRTDRAHFRRFRKSRSCFRNALPARYRIFFYVCVCCGSTRQFLRRCDESYGSLVKLEVDLFACVNFMIVTIDTISGENVFIFA